MIKKAARTGLTLAAAQRAFNEATRLPGAVAEMAEQGDGRWTVTVVWDDTGAPVEALMLSVFEKSASALTRSTPSLADAPLGALSERFESNGKPGAIGHDSTGGFSYGQYQIASATGTLAAFLAFLGRSTPALLAPLAAAGGASAALLGAAAFQQAWRSLAADTGFARAQHDFIQATHYDPLVARLNHDPGLDAGRFSRALNDVIWSVAVQHGPGNTVIQNALIGTVPNTLPEAVIINRIYAERSKVDRYFARSSAQVRAAVRARFAQERALALQMLQALAA
jgi:Glycosyl hydrolase family 46